MIADFLSDVRYRVRALFRRAELERELDDELRFHLEREAEKNERSGVDRAEAMRRAQMSFGGVDRMKEESRDTRGVHAIETVARDLRYAARGLRARPGFTLAVVITLGLGIGANAAMFGLVDRLMLRPAAYLRDPGAVNQIYLEYTFRKNPIVNGSIEYQRYLDFAQASTTVQQFAAYHSTPLAIGDGDGTREMQVAVVSASYFTLFDARPVLGRFFDSTEDVPPNGTPVVVIGSTLWKTRFGERRDVVGQKLRVGPIDATIIGVAPEGFSGMDATHPAVAFLPIAAYAGQSSIGYLKNYEWGWLRVFARRKPHVAMQEEKTDLTRAYVTSWERERAIEPSVGPVADAKPHVVLAPQQALRAPDSGRDGQVVLWTSGVAAIVLLIACANVANLLLARAFGRRREIAVRLALGVTRKRLAAQLLTESVLLALLAAAAGVVVGELVQTILRTLFLPRTTQIGVLDDSRTIVFAVLVAALAGILTGLAPVLQSGRGDLTLALKSGVREGSGERSRTRSVLLLAQGALSVILLVGAGLFVRSLQNVAAIRLGYDVDPVLLVSTNMRGMKLPDGDAYRLTTRLAQESRTIAGVEAASQITTAPLYQMMSMSFSVPGIDSAALLYFGSFSLQMGEGDFFRATGTRILRGRGIDSTDRGGTPRVVVLSRTMAEKLWPGSDAIGKCIKFEPRASSDVVQRRGTEGAEPGDSALCTTVVGIAEDIRANDIQVDKGMQYYLPIDQYRPNNASLFVRVHGSAPASAERVRKALQPLMPGASYVTVTPMRDIVDPALRSWRLGATMFLLFGLLALVLAAVGLYSVIAYNVAQRSHELGLRIALGAHARDVLRMVLGEGLRFGFAGIAVGVTIAFAASHWMQPMLFGESARDPLVFAIVAAVLLFAAAAASAIPAARAVHVDPSTALRTE